MFAIKSLTALVSALFLAVSFFGVLLQHHRASACTCLAPELPAYCTTDFFLVADILGKTENSQRTLDRYRFKPVHIIVDPQKVISGRKLKVFITSAASSACGVELEVGERYLIGGMISPTSPNRLRLDLCRSYVQLLPGKREEFSNLNTTTGNSQFDELLQNCAKINLIEK